MTAKEYLSQARLLDARINAKIQQVAALNDLATHATATLTGMPRNPNRSESRMAEAVAEFTAKVKASGGYAINLRVSGMIHCPELSH